MTTGSATAADGGARRPFIGREKELAAIRAAIGNARAGHRRVVVLAGPPGIGKTRTAQHVAEHEAAGMLVLWGRCPEEAGAPPYWPWVQVIRHYLRQQDPATIGSVLGSAAPQLGALDPGLASLLGVSPAASPTVDAAQARFRLFDAVTGFWQRAAARQPLLIIIDDLHGADESSLRLLEFVARETEGSPVLLLGTFRDAQVTRTHPLSDTLALLTRLAGTERLKLGGFSEEETARFVRGTVKNAPPGLFAAMHQRTEGHPLFLGEMTRLLDERAGAADLQHVPAEVREVIGSRLNRLSPLCGRALGVAAVIGRRFDFRMLRLLLEECPEDELVAAIDESRNASLVEPLAEPGAYQFTHVLIRDTLYEELPPPQRMHLHLRVADTLEQLHGEGASPWLSTIAHHYLAAGWADRAGKALTYASRAARHADATLAYEEAARLYAEALRLVAPGSDGQRCELLLALGEVQTRAGRNATALDTFADAAGIARRLGDVDALASAALGYETCSWRANGVGVVAAALIKEALAADSPLDSPRRARLLAALCRALVYADRVDAAVAIHGQAVHMARRLADTEALFAALSAIVPARWRPDLLPLRLAAGREAMEIAERAGNPEWAVGHLTGWHVGDLMESGDAEAAAHTVNFGADAARIREQPYVHTVLVNCRAMMALHAGRFEEAERLATESLRHTQLLGQASGAAAVQLFTLRREQGRLAELAPVLEHFQRTVPDSVTWLPGFIVLCCELGRLEQAREAFERLARKDFQIGGPSDGARAGGLVYLGESCRRLADAPRAAALYALLLPHAGKGIVFGAHVASLGSADRVLGMLAATTRQWDVAQTHFERAMAFDAASGGRPWLAHTRHEYATMLLDRQRPGDAERARELLELALAVSRELGMHALEAAVLALQPASGDDACPAYPAGLTEREVQVLRMVAEGRTNQDIADALFRSVNTVANHVRHILSKIDAANRTEAAAFAARHGLLKR
jgi:DNA-binding CsgD family transcriptional regulator/DNA polymerase III delta prime subunit